MSHAYRLGDDHSYGAILNNGEGRNASSSVSSNHFASTDGTYAVASGAPEGITADGSAPSSSSSSSSPAITLNLKTLTGQVMTIQVPTLEGVTIQQLKQTFESAHGIPVQLQRWIWAGREVTDSMSATECRMENGCTIHLLLRQNPAAGPVSAQVGVPAGGMPAGAMAPQYAPAYLNNGFPGGVMDAGAVEGHVNIPADRLMELQRAYQLARAVRIFAVIDAVFLILWAFNFWPLAIGVVLCIFGWYGATHVRFPHVAVYLVYLFFAVALRVFLVVIAPDVLYRVLFVLSILIEIYIIRLTIQFMRIIKTLNEEERTELIFMIRPYARPAPLMQYV